MYIEYMRNLIIQPFLFNNKHSISVIKRLCHHHSKTYRYMGDSNDKTYNHSIQNLNEFRDKLVKVDKDLVALKNQLCYVYIIQIFTIPIFICWNF